jgi:hypothetical protein
VPAFYNTFLQQGATILNAPNTRIWTGILVNVQLHNRKIKVEGTSFEKEVIFCQSRCFAGYRLAELQPGTNG